MSYCCDRQRFPWREAKTAPSVSLDQRKRLDLYADLSWLPKHIDLARDPMKDDMVADAESEAPEDLSIRQQGRLRHKKALLAKLHKDESGSGSSAAFDRSGEGPEQKKIKRDNPASGDKIGDEKLGINV